MKPFDNYEIRGVHKVSDDGRTFREQVPDDQATFWTLCGHLHGEGVETIGHFATRQHAEETFQRITGIPFAGTSEAVARVRVMHAGPKLLEALYSLKEALSLHHHWKPDMPAHLVNLIDAAVAEVTGEVSPDLRSPIVIEVRGGVVQDVLNVPSGIEYEIRDYDNLDDAEDADDGRAAHRHIVRRYAVYQLANDEVTYGPDAGKFIVTSADHEQEYSGPMSKADAVALAATLNACTMVVDRWEKGDLAEAARACRAAIADATRRPA